MKYPKKKSDIKMMIIAVVVDNNLFVTEYTAKGN